MLERQETGRASLIGAALLLAAMLAAGATTAVLHPRVEALAATQAPLRDLRVQAYRQMAQLGHAAYHSQLGLPGDAVWGQVRDAQRQVREQQQHLVTSAPRAAGLEALWQEANALDAALEAELLHVSVGNWRRAHEVHEAQVEPAHLALDRAITAAQREYAGEERRLERVGDAAALVFIAMAVLLGLRALWTQYRRARRTIAVLEGEREAARARAEHDALTGLLNRRGLAREYAALPPGAAVHLVMLDLNRLKDLNDEGGHGAGDAHLRHVADVLRRHLPSSGPPSGPLSGRVCRWGGDEFVVMLPLAAPPEDYLARVEAEIPAGPSAAAPFAAGHVRADSGEPLDRVIALADAAMYARKHVQRQAARLSASSPDTLEEFAARLEALERPDDIRREGLALARHLLGFDAAFDFGWQGGRVVLRPPLDPRAQEVVTRLAAHRGSGAFRLTLLKQAVRDGRPVCCHDYPSEPDASPALVDLGIKSLAALPIRVAGETVGILVLTHLHTWRPIAPQVLHVLELIASRAAHALRLERAVSDVRRTLEGGMLALGLALEARDLETAGHTRRVVALARALGEHLNLGAEDAEALVQGAYLHDLGKLAVPDAILCKPGRLTPGEWTVMQSHAERGHALGLELPGLTPSALEVIRHHHERWDGAGYPAGLAGEAIPLLARIFAVADVYDALTSERPYKRAWTHEEAAAEITAQARRQFDPRVVAAFLAVVSAAPQPPSDPGRAVPLLS